MYKSYLDRLGISQLKPMQEAAINTIQQGKDVVILSPTGSGKTLAFLLPILKMIEIDRNGVQVLILTPSRELALQIEQVFRQLQSGFKVNSCYGGHPVSTERNNLKEPPVLLVGTPGRIADHIRRETLMHPLYRPSFWMNLINRWNLGFKKRWNSLPGSCKELKPASSHRQPVCR